jgi:dolichyl-phosphate beta-glucosyltransferase
MPLVSAGRTSPARSLVIPMYDERARIGESIRVLAESLPADDDLEILLVDDGSTDGTAEVAEAALAAARFTQARVLRLPENRGKGAAVRAGMLAARGRSRVFVDADLCVGADDIGRCFAELEAGRADVVYGTRAHPGSELHRNQPAHRVLSGRVYNVLLRSLGLTDERDTQCGLKGFSADAATSIFERLATERFAFDVEVLARAGRSGMRVVPLPVQWSHVEASRVRPVRDGVDMARAAVRIRRQLDLEVEEASEGPAMDTGAIEAMALVERTHWWFRAKRELVLEELDRRRISGVVVDVGAGTGGLLDALRAAGRPAIGVELDDVALKLAARLEPRPLVVQAVAERVPVADGEAAAVTALDVLEHLDDDVVGFRELARVAGPGGLVVVAVPAYRWAWSEHDVRLGHRRRYTRVSLVAAAHAADIDVVRCTHFHGWLAPVALLLRRTPLRRLLRGQQAEEASFVSPAANRALAMLGGFERFLLRRFDLPVGLSILLVGRVSDAGEHASRRGRGTPTR